MNKIIDITVHDSFYEYPLLEGIVELFLGGIALFIFWLIRYGFNNYLLIVLLIFVVIILMLLVLFVFLKKNIKKRYFKIDTKSNFITIRKIFSINKYDLDNVRFKMVIYDNRSSSLSYILTIYSKNKKIFKICNSDMEPKSFGSIYFLDLLLDNFRCEIINKSVISDKEKANEKI